MLRVLSNGTGRERRRHGSRSNKSISSGRDTRRLRRTHYTAESKQGAELGQTNLDVSHLQLGCMCRAHCMALISPRVIGPPPSFLSTMV